MEIIAITTQLSRYLFAALAVALCIMLFRRERQFGWLLVSVAFIPSFYALLMRAIHGRPLLTYMSSGTSPEGFARIGYRVDFPIFYLVAIIGLYLLVQQKRHEPAA